MKYAFSNQSNKIRKLEYYENSYSDSQSNSAQLQNTPNTLCGWSKHQNNQLTQVHLVKGR